MRRVATLGLLWLATLVGCSGSETGNPTSTTSACYAKTAVFVVTSTDAELLSHVAVDGDESVCAAQAAAVTCTVADPTSVDGSSHTLTITADGYGPASIELDPGWNFDKCAEGQNVFNVSLEPLAAQ